MQINWAMKVNIIYSSGVVKIDGIIMWVLLF